MTTEAILAAINRLFREAGQDPLEVPEPGPASSELGLLLEVKRAYLQRLQRVMPQYKTMPEDLIPDVFFVALIQRESELRAPPP